MKSFANGDKVEVLYSGDDSAPSWVPATVVNEVRAGMGFERHGQFSGNIVKLDGNGKALTVTEPIMIRNA